MRKKVRVLGLVVDENSEPTQDARYRSETWRNDARWKLMRRVCASIGLILTLSFVLNALAQGSTVKTVHFSAHLDDPGDRLTLGGVDPSCPVGWVAIRTHEPAHLSGQFRSTDTGGGCVSWDPVAQLNDLKSGDGPGFVFAGHIDDHQVGSLDGCGTGRVTMRLTDLTVRSFDVASGTGHLTLKWVVVDGTGTGAFLGASGKGTGSVDGTVSPDFGVPLLTAPFVVPNWGTYEGTITCPHHS